MNLQILQTMGLSGTESSLYELLLKLGEVPVASIIRESGLKRPTIYKALYTLEAKGLVSSRDHKKKIHFKPESPLKLVEQVENNYAEAQQVRNTLQAAIPQLLSAYSLSTERPVVQIYEGVEGLKKVFLDTIEEKAEIYAIAHTGEIEPKLHEWLDSTYVKLRKKQSIHAKVILSSSQHAFVLAQNDLEQLRVTKIVPHIQFPFQHEVNIYRDKIAFINYKKGEQLIGIIIKNESMAKTMKAWFDLAWEGAERKPYPTSA